jgi:hypothetical protein
MDEEDIAFNEWTQGQNDDIDEFLMFNRRTSALSIPSDSSFEYVPVHSVDSIYPKQLEVSQFDNGGIHFLIDLFIIPLWITRFVFHHQIINDGFTSINASFLCGNLR